jgi:OOP family OmpA-OmpF porin
MRKSLISAAALAAVLASPAIFAADNGIYIGASVGQSGVKFDDTIEDVNLDYDADATAYKVIAGWRFLDWLSVEANYVDLGSGDDTVLGEKLETEIDGITLSAVGFLPVGPVDLFARVGMINWDASLSAPNLDLRSSEDGNDLAYGVGAQFRVWGLSLRAEYERFEISDVDTVDMISLGLTYTFL